MNNLSQAIDSWKTLLGQDRVLTSTDDLKKYHFDTNTIHREIPAALLAKSTDDVISIVKTANQFGIPLYPISTGNNWGYGSANPASNGSVIVDLSSMKKIVDYDAELGTVTVEPGVTQQILADFLLKNNDEYLTPTSGAGPNASILGNAVERGYGLTPIADHFQALLSLEAVLPDGTLYHSALYNDQHKTTDQVFKWGIGPYLDGIFTQGNFGVVTKVTIQLSARPEKVGVFVIEMKNEEDLEKTVVLVKEILRDMGGITGSINLMNSLRLCAMSSPYPADRINKSPEDFVTLLQKIAAESGFSPWTCVGSFYGKKEVVDAASLLLKEKVYPFTRRLLVISRAQVAMLETIFSLLPFKIAKRSMKRIQGMKLLFDIVEGRPTFATLPLSYRKLPKGVDIHSTDLNPARDQCGLLWYAPLIPMRPQVVREFVNFVYRVCDKYKIEPLITLTSLSSRCFDSTVPILFDPANSEETARAKGCFNELFKEGNSLGFYPYRVGVDNMKDLVNPEKSFWAMQGMIKKAIDPKGIIAPGRYSI